MKKQFLALFTAFIAMAVVTQAQTKTTFGVRAGVNFTNINGKDGSGDKLDNKMIAGLNVGVNAEIPIAPEFYIQPGVLFSTKGAKADNNSDLKIHISYIEVPINFLYKPDLGDGHLLLGVGPYIAFGVGGKMKGNNIDKDLKFKNEVTALEALSDPYVKRIDAGGNLLFGYEFSNKFSAQLNAQLGLVKINPKITGASNDDTKWNNTGFGVSLGYRF